MLYNRLADHNRLFVTPAIKCYTSFYTHIETFHAQVGESKAQNTMETVFIRARLSLLKCYLRSLNLKGALLSCREKSILAKRRRSYFIFKHVYIRVLVFPCELFYCSIAHSKANSFSARENVVYSFLLYCPNFVNLD